MRVGDGAAHVLVDQILDPPPLLLGERPRRGEVEAQAVGSDQRPGLPHPLAEHLAQGGVQEVGGGVVALGVAARTLVDRQLDRARRRRGAPPRRARSGRRRRGRPSGCRAPGRGRPGQVRGCRCRRPGRPTRRRRRCGRAPRRPPRRWPREVAATASPPRSLGEARSSFARPQLEAVVPEEPGRRQLAAAERRLQAASRRWRSAGGAARALALLLEGAAKPSSSTAKRSSSAISRITSSGKPKVS
jgi:hypothetical protein